MPAADTWVWQAWVPLQRVEYYCSTLSVSYQLGSNSILFVLCTRSNLLLLAWPSGLHVHFIRSLQRPRFIHNILHAKPFIDYHCYIFGSTSVDFHTECAISSLHITYHHIHHIAPHHIMSHCHYITPHYITPHCITPHYITPHYITPHYITLHHATSHHPGRLLCGQAFLKCILVCLL